MIQDLLNDGHIHPGLVDMIPNVLRSVCVPMASVTPTA
jgi:hypothetical protein